MSILVIDCETYYDSDYSLSKLTTEEYINNVNFEVIGISIKVDSDAAQWFSGPPATLYRRLQDFDFQHSLVIAHNTIFDAAILEWKFGIKADFYADTLSMARAFNGPDAGGSLAKLARAYDIGEKGTEVHTAKGKRLKNFSSQELASYGQYCCNDVELTYGLFNKLLPDFNETELKLIHQTLLMFLRPSLMLDKRILENRLIQVREEKSVLLRNLMVDLKCDSEEQVRKILSSAKKFSEVLESYGCPAPIKPNSKGLPIPALAKTDAGFLALEEHPDPLIQQLCAARLGTKSTLEESRLERFLGIYQRNSGRLPIPLKYYAAHTGRWGGLDLINLQNLPTRDLNKKSLKNSIIAPPGYVIINADLSQIEARILAWLAGQDDVVRAFAEGRDIYCEDATKAFGRKITRQDKKERFVGKTMRLGLGYGTGFKKLQETLKQQGGVELSSTECMGLVNTWRALNQNIVRFWGMGDNTLKQLAYWPDNGDTFYFDKHKLLPVVPMGIALPNGMFIKYPNLRKQTHKFVYDSRKGPVNIWGGYVVENVVQALARIVVGEYLIKIAETHTVALTVHDSLVLLAQLDQLEDTVAHVSQVMSTPPSWAPGLPVAVEVKHGVSYGDC